MFIRPQRVLVADDEGLVSDAPQVGRALNPAVEASRMGRRAVEPIAGKLVEWHRLTAVLAARLNRAELRGGQIADLLPAIEAQIREIESELKGWRASLEVDDRTGHVLDAERSCKSILRSLADLRSRALP